MNLYKDTIKLEFNSVGHRYTVSKHVKDDLWTVPNPVTGVTTIISIISKPSLMLWPLREAIKALEPSAGAKLTKKLLDDAYAAHKQKADSGKHTGKVGHALVEALLTGKKVKLPTDEELLKQVESITTAFEKWKTDFEPEVMSAEMVFYSLVHDYAGTCDLLCTIDGKVTVVDFKTTNPSYHNPEGIYAENFAQLGGYIIGIEEMTGEAVHQAMIVNLPKDGSDYKLKSLSDMGLSVVDAKMYFLQALGLYNSHREFDWKLKQ